MWKPISRKHGCVNLADKGLSRQGAKVLANMERDFEKITTHLFGVENIFRRKQAALTGIDLKAISLQVGTYTTGDTVKEVLPDTH